LAQEGYATAAFVANTGYLPPRLGLARGFDTYENQRPERGVQISADALAWLDARAKAKTSDAARPFFLFLNYMDAHEPYMPPPPYDRLFPGRDPAFRREDRQKLEKRVLRGAATVTPRQLAHLTSQYDGGIAYIDSELTRFLHHLEATGLFEEALVIVTADHGEAFGDHHLFGHDISVYQEGVHVPLLVRTPRQPRGATVASLVSLTDLFPTLLEEAGAPIPPGIDGRSLLGAAPDPDREVLSETFGNSLAGRWQPHLGSASRAIYQGDLKLIVPTLGNREAFDLVGDPAETRNLYRSEARWRDLEQHLDRWLREAASSAGGTRRALDAETAAALKALGYL